MAALAVALVWLAAPCVFADSPLAEPRLGWPPDARLSGIYANIDTIGQPWFPGYMTRLAASGMNAVVVDGKDYSGWLTYPSSIPLATETRASSHMVLKSLPRLVHEAHARRLRVLLRVACFHDPWLATHRKDLAIHGMTDWLDPKNPEVDDYLLAVVGETLSAGVDEIQLDYVRYPTEGVAHADFGLGSAKSTEVIADFVGRVHELTQAAGVPLSIDVFGVVAWQREADVRATGQDLTRLGPLVEAVSPMVYPSHFREGFNGYPDPGAHPEVVGIGTRQTEEALRKAGATAVVRPWIQAFPWRAPNYSPTYVAEEIGQAAAAHGVGWLAWNAHGSYDEVVAAASQTRGLR